MRTPFARLCNRLLSPGLGLTLLLPAAAAPARVAVLARTPALDAAADLLSVLLSLRSDLAVVDRAEVRRMLQEQTLLANPGAQVARVGRLLGADGLVFLEIPAVPQKASPAPAVKPERAARLSARLVAVRPGVVLTELTDAWPAPDLAQWAAGAVERFAPFLPKLSVLEADAVPLSILNLRHATAVAGRELEERALTRLLASRLMCEKTLFVLERRRMESLSFEKELLGEGTNSFWKGAWLLEGTINPEGATAGRTSLRLTLTAPDRAQPLRVDAEAAEGDYPALIEQLTRGVLKALARQPEATSWSAAKEAVRYAEEARWALKWGLLPEAIEAAEAAWALGQQDLDTAKLRLQPYVKAAVPSQTNLMCGYKVKRLPPPPDPRKIPLAQRCLDLFREGTARFAPDQPKPDYGWYSLGVDALLDASLLLQAHLLTPSELGKHVEELETLRRAIPAALALYDASPALSRTNWERPDGFPFIRMSYPEYTMVRERNIHWLKVRFGAFWHERPEETMAMYRSLFFGPLGRECRSWFLTRNTCEPIVLARDVAKRQEMARLWQAIVQDLVRSDDLAQKLHGHLFRLMLASNDAEMKAAADAFFELLHANHVAVEDGQLDRHWPTDIERAIRWQRNRHTTAAYGELQRRFEKLRREWAAWEKVGFERRVARTHAVVIPVQRDLAVASSNAPALRIERRWLPALPVEDLIRLPGPKPLRPGPGVVSIGRQVPPLPLRKMKDFSLYALAPHGCALVDGTVWVEYGLVPHYWGIPLSKRRGLFFSFDLSSGASRRIGFPEAAANAQGPRRWFSSSFAPGGLQAFDLLNDTLFLADLGRLWACDLASGRWSDLGLSIPKRTALTTVGSRLILCSPESIAEYDPTARRLTTLASTRRRPALSELDKLSFREIPRPFQTADGRLGVLVDKTVFGWSAQDRDWETWTNHNNGSQGSGRWFRGNPAAWSVKRIFDADRLFVVSDRGHLPQLLLEDPPKLQGMDTRRRSKVLAQLLGSPRWTDPRDRRLAKGVAAYANGCLAVVLPENPDPNAPVNHDVYGEFRRVVMVLFGDGFDPGATLALELHAPPPPWKYTTQSGLFRGIGYLKPVSDGWVLMLNQQPGLWHITRREVEDWLATHPATAK